MRLVWDLLLQLLRALVWPVVAPFTPNVRAYHGPSRVLMWSATFMLVAVPIAGYIVSANNPENDPHAIAFFIGFLVYAVGGIIMLDYLDREPV